MDKIGGSGTSQGVPGAGRFIGMQAMQGAGQLCWGESAPTLKTCANVCEPLINKRGGGPPTDGAVAFGGANGEPAGADVNGSDCGSFGDAEEEDEGDQDDAICWGDGQPKLMAWANIAVMGNQLRRGGGARRVSALTATQYVRAITRSGRKLLETKVRAAKTLRADPGRGGFDKWRR